MSKNIKSEPAVEPGESVPGKVKNEPHESAASGEPSSSKASTSQQPAKRSFVPNLAVRRSEKDATSEPAKTDASTSKQRERKPFVPNLSNRGRNTRGSNLIQTHSVFEAGPAESTKRYGSNETAESYSKVVGPSGQPHSSSTGSRQIKSESSQDNYVKVEHSLLIEDTTKEDLAKAAYVNLKFETKEYLNEQDIEVKRNELDAQLTGLFTRDESDEKLILLQMPENLNLNEMNEGHVGKIRVYKSGKIEFCLNQDKYMNVNLSVAGSFLQEAAVLELNNPEQTDKVVNNKMTNLGQIQTKLVCSPVL